MFLHEEYFFDIKFYFIANLSTPVNVATFRSCCYYVQEIYWPTTRLYSVA